MFPECSLNVPWMFPEWRYVPGIVPGIFLECFLSVFPEQSKNVPWMTACSLNGTWMFPEWDLNVPWTTVCSPNVPWMTICSLNVPGTTVCSLNAPGSFPQYSRIFYYRRVPRQEQSCILCRLAWQPIHGTFREHLGNIKRRGNLQGTFREHSGNI
jgi:hypothetical protein